MRIWFNLFLLLARLNLNKAKETLSTCLQVSVLFQSKADWSPGSVIVEAPVAWELSELTSWRS